MDCGLYDQPGNEEDLLVDSVGAFLYEQTTFVRHLRGYEGTYIFSFSRSLFGSEAFR